ncbi:phage tail tape measure protein [Xenorhabdus griffiniae]|uniref:Phage tail tape measure protein n=1 Tax=Xenorhabdus griffiniae TaxID=351672 RepID=A0ABY9XKS4_9GAMM|nr:phage tail tape measure protein [Xenorhabdus griffiniae]MBD1228653.1 phage tail tape measure protein [Xenorhabdus griffiniae]MBE8588197.1 phage tail tape measure protein [Xenorhabdus griffiniae]WMV73542.1 phage tail tape measure protein [Xenorhabdus griffiniae]WNH03222.1 phage tail tape measure protein [Xenorhabdus griffiniae]
MTDVATISLKVNTSDLERGEQKLNSFKDAADKASNSTNKLTSQSEKSAAASADMAKEIDRIHRSVTELAAKEQRAAASAKVLAAEQDKVAESFFKQIDAIKRNATATEQLTRIQAEARKARKSEKLDLESYRNILSDIIGKKKQMAEADAKQTAAGQAFITRLKDQLATQNLSRNELLKYRAAQLGVSSAAEIYINKLKETSKETKNLNRNNTSVIAGLRNISDSMGMGVLLRGGGWGAVITGIGGVTKAYYHALEVQENFNKAIIASGRFAGITQGQLIGYADNISKTGAGADVAAEALTKLMNAGLKLNVDIGKAGESIVEFSRYSGQSVDELVSHFARLSDDPYGGSVALNKQYRYLSVNVLQHIKELELQGKITEAVTYATDALSGAMAERAKEIRNSMGTLPKLFDEIKRAANLMWDSVMGIGAKPSEAEHRARLVLKIRTAENDPRRYNGKKPSISNEILDQWKKELRELDTKIKKEKESAELQERSITSQIKFNQLVDKGTSWTEKRKHEHKMLNKLIKENIQLAKEGKTKLWTAEDIAKARAGIEHEFRDRRGPGYGKKLPKEPKFKVDAGTRADESAKARILALQAELRALSDESRYVGIISQQRRELLREQAKFNILENAQKERKLSLDETLLLAKKNEILAEKEKAAELGDRIEKQKQLNALRLSNDGLEEELRLRHESIGKTDEQIAKERELLNLRGEMRRKGISEGDSEYLRRIDLVEQKYANEESLRSNWEAGVKKGFENFEKEASNTYGNVAQITQATFMGMSNSLSDFLLTGKANFADFTKSVLEMITKMLMQMAMLQAMKAAFGGTSFGATLGFAGGGYTGNGGKYEPKGIVHGGEFVFTKEATMRLGVANLYRLMDSTKKGYASGGHVGGSQPMTVSTPAPIMYGIQPASAGGVQVNLGGIRVEGQQQQSIASNIDAQAAEQSLTRKIRAVIVQESRDGGDLYKIIRAARGRNY